jgi:DNA end-binding protein Ku
MAPRANWKGNLQLGDLSCPVALYSAATTSERISFHMINRKTGHRLRRVFVDTETGKPVEADEQVKGYQTETDDYVVLEPEEIAAVIPESDKTISIKDFIECGSIDTVYFDKPYYLAPVEKGAHELFALIIAGMAERKVAALARAVLFRRLRTLLVRPQGNGLVAHTLHYDYEVRSAKEAFDDLPTLKIGREMTDLAQHIIKTKMGKFDPTAFDDRYDAALAELVKAKAEGKPLPKRAPPKEPKVVDLMAALKASAAESKGGGKKKTGKAKATAPASKRRAKKAA